MKCLKLFIIEMWLYILKCHRLCKYIYHIKCNCICTLWTHEYTLKLSEITAYYCQLSRVLAAAYNTDLWWYNSAKPLSVGFDFSGEIETHTTAVQQFDKFNLSQLFHISIYIRAYYRIITQNYIIWFNPLNYMDWNFFVLKFIQYVSYQL